MQNKGGRVVGENHSHPDFQGGRRHDRDRRHQGNLSPRLHLDQAPRKIEIRDGPTAKQIAAIVDIAPDRTRALEQYKMAIASIPIEELYGQQLEVRGVCGKCRGRLRHPMDGHYHSINENGCVVLCCSCLLDIRGITCADSWTKMKGLREKISAIAEKAEERLHYWVCVPCGHKWRNKNPKARACSECGSKKVKGVHRKERAS
jgi:hypothetical protein